MNILSIDCCLKLTGAALMIDDVISGYEQKDLGRSQSSELPRITERLIHSAGLDWRDINYIVLTIGPGYFTGIRVGASYSSGLAYGTGAKIIPVSTLEMLSHGRKAKTLTLIYAGHDFVYASCDKYLNAGEYSHEQIKLWLTENPDAEVISDDPERTGLNDIEIIQVKPDILSLSELGRKNINNAVSPVELKMLYYRAPQGVN